MPKSTSSVANPIYKKLGTLAKQLLKSCAGWYHRCPMARTIPLAYIHSLPSEMLTGFFILIVSQTIHIKLLNRTVTRFAITDAMEVDDEYCVIRDSAPCGHCHASRIIILVHASQMQKEVIENTTDIQTEREIISTKEWQELVYSYSYASLCVESERFYKPTKSRLI